jgi:hypothetical protein
MNNIILDIEKCYLDKINISTLKNKLGFEKINDYSFAKELINLAISFKNSDAVHIAFMIFDDYPLKEMDFSILEVFFFDWHDAHEDIVFTVSHIKNCKLVDFFLRAIEYVQEYMDEEDHAGLTRKVFFGLGENKTCPKAIESLNQFRLSPNAMLRDFAKEQFELFTT